ncbi:hypothetical protein AB7C87_14645 [Natrarchaeobius sp. A-rgal3]|uniref:hypothetical protein n=1 Tax=Natrarchaeobius versutus TaxID=1679078 RepID=UPI00350F6D24
MSQSTEEPVSEPQAEGIREIGHDEYDPVGTLALITLYFLVLIALWFFVYFVEFLGNDPTVVGAAVVTVA